MQRTILIGSLAAVLASAVHPAVATAKLSPDTSCRFALGPAAAKGVKKALGLVDKCLKKTPSASCNVVDQGVIAKALAPVAKKCAAAECTKALYGGDVAAAMAAAIKAALEANGTAVLPAPSTGGDKAKTKCLKGVVSGRSKLLLKSLAPAIRSERLRKAECSPVADASVAPNTTLGAAVSKGISKACGALQGADLGVCASLPGCVVDQSDVSLRRLGKAIYTARPVCGDGVTEGTEECDDGNQDGTDACTSTCGNAKCGDGFVHAGVEACDDGNVDDTDACLQTCEAARCGDGFVLKDSAEQCDDGNADDGDLCKTDCTLNRVACGPNGLNVTVDASVQPHTVVGLSLEVHFDHTKISIPGRGIDGLDRTTSLIPDPETDDLLVVNDELYDQDTDMSVDPDRVRVVFIKDGGTLIDGIDAGPFVTIRYDCAADATFLPTDFGCEVLNASTGGGVPVTGVSCSVPTLVPAP